jgi:hypothetical protein
MESSPFEMKTPKAIERIGLHPSRVVSDAGR